ncbi:Membrane glycoprotein spo14 [Gracilariopsis chorda]|uniref:Membrane glycoprotein spo14 n=1 Tax=Gracilariopsis chorda TaxID=448386 RepID=A0A2V3IV01_9FLOR|nr:Membrane glycoprotein spo14 [Gracilariopsis chorda]|eukprot:PXF45527.1 Membrane glycoprotein spo14 [Gracilariopsis chorda]
MEPINRVSFTFPIYALDGLPGNRVAVAGGGGQMKSGIPNACEVLSFDESSAELISVASTELSDAAVALATHGSVIHIVMGPGVKDYVYKSEKIVPSSSFEHDLQVSTTQEQTAVAASEDGSTLVVASDNGNVVVLRLERFEPVFSGPIHTNGITDLSITSDGSLVGTAGRDKLAQIWKSKDGEVLQTLDTVMPTSIRTHIRAIRFCSAQPDVIFTAESNPKRGGWIAAWRKSSTSEIARYSPIAKIKASSDALTAMCVNNEGSLLASSSAEGHVSLFAWDGLAFSKIWSTETRTNIFKASTPPHVLPVTGMHFTNSDEHLNELIRNRRAQIAPYMEPHLSEVQGVVRPFVREQHRSLYTHISKLRKKAQLYLRDASRRIPAMLISMPRTLQRQIFAGSNEIGEAANTVPQELSDDFPKAILSSSEAIAEGSEQEQLTVSHVATTSNDDGFGQASAEAVVRDASVAVSSLDKGSPTEFRNEALTAPTVQNNKEQEKDAGETSVEQFEQHLEDSSGNPFRVPQSTDGFPDVSVSVGKNSSNAS